MPHIIAVPPLTPECPPEEEEPKPRLPPSRKTLERHAATLYPHLNCVTMFVGAMGRGKTLSTVMMAHWMQQLFLIHGPRGYQQRTVVSIGTSVGLNKDSFGPIRHISVKEFIEQLQLMSAIAQEIIEQGIDDEEDIAHYLQFAVTSRGLLLYKAILICDEFHKLTNARKPTDRLNMAMLEFIAQLRHYDCTMIVQTPNPRNVDRQVRDQVRWVCKPDMDKVTSECRLVFRGPEGIHKWSFKGKLYFDMYNTKQFTGFNSKALEKVLAKDV